MTSTKTLAALAGPLLLVAGLSAAARGDTVFLQDGREVHGRLLDNGRVGVVEIETAGGLLRYPAILVKRVEKNERGLPGQAGGEASPSADEQAASPEARADFAAALRQAEAAETAAAGRDAWKAFFAKHLSSPLAGRARDELAVWSRRIEQDLVRFGPEWIARAEFESRRAKAMQLLEQAGAAADLNDALALYDQAAQAHPYLVEAPFAKGARLYQAGRPRPFAAAMGEAVKIQDGHPAARNNLGALAAAESNWAVAFRSLGRAAEGLDEDRILDNFDLAMALAERAGWPKGRLAEAEATLAKIVKAHHDAGRHVGLVRWGNRWISQAQCDQYRAENEKKDREESDLRGRMAALDRAYRDAGKERDDLEEQAAAARGGRGGGRGDWGRGMEHMRRSFELQRQIGQARQRMEQMERQGRGMQAELKALQAARRTPEHARDLVLLAVDGHGELGRIKMTPDPAPPAAAPPPGQAPARKGG